MFFQSDFEALGEMMPLSLSSRMQDPPSFQDSRTPLMPANKTPSYTREFVIHVIAITPVASVVCVLWVWVVVVVCVTVCLSV